MSRFIQYILIVLLSVLSFNSFAQKVLLLKDGEQIYQLDSSYFVRINNYPEKITLQKPDKLFLFNPILDSSYWFRFSIKNEDPVIREWLMVSYNYSIDEIDVITVSESGASEKQLFRNTMSIYDRKIKHKQPVFPIKIAVGETKTVYVRIKNESSYQYVFAFYSEYNFLSYFFREYMLYGLFYGLMLFVFLYSLMNFIFLRDKVILFYVFFILCQSLHMLFRDGNGLFLLPVYSEYADRIRNICKGGLSVSVILYTLYFLKIQNGHRLYKFLWALIIFRALVTIFLMEDILYITFHVDLFIIFLCTALSIRALIRNYSDAKYLAIGFTFLCISSIVYYLSVLVFPSLNTIGFFGMYYGIALESIFMTIALTERYKRTKLDNFKKERMNKELEQMITERTELVSLQNKMLEERSQELNLFLYSTSHDLKGPLKTIKGLCQLALIDKDTDPEKIYRMIIAKLAILESNINDINLVAQLKNVSPSDKKLDFYRLHKDVLETFLQYPGIDEVKINLSISLAHAYSANLFTMRCIYQNIFENAIKYRDLKKSSALDIFISDEKGRVEIIFEDNGQGIRADMLPNIFDMFYRANENSREDTGLGLYIVKLAVQRLEGNITAESVEGKGTKFIVTIALPLA